MDMQQINRNIANNLGANNLKRGARRMATNSLPPPLANVPMPSAGKDSFQFIRTVHDGFNYVTVLRPGDTTVRFDKVTDAWVAAHFRAVMVKDGDGCGDKLGRGVISAKRLAAIMKGSREFTRQRSPSFYRK